MSTERKEVDTFPLKIKIFFHKKVLPVLLIVGWVMGTVHFCDILNHFGIRGVLEVIYAIAFFGIMVYAFYYVSKDK